MPLNAEVFIIQDGEPRIDPDKNKPKFKVI